MTAEEFLNESRDSLYKLKLIRDSYIALSIASPDNKKFSALATQYKKEYDELHVTRELCRDELRDIKCSPFIGKLSSLMAATPVIMNLFSGAPNRIWKTMNLHCYPEIESIKRFRDVYWEWQLALTPETSHLHTSAFTIYYLFRLQTQANKNGTVMSFNRDHQLFFWKGKVHWMKNYKLPDFAVKDLLTCGITEDEVRALYPGFSLPVKR